MTRSILALVAIAAVAAIVAGPGCQATGIGDPCTPEQEYDPTFAGFDEKEVNVESKSFQCQTRVCLANHFRGRVSCPYGQDTSGAAPPMARSPNDMHCVVPGTSIPIDPTLDPNGNPLNPPPKSGKAVQAQCTDRNTDKAVYCSCRCANVDGNTGDGANYCKCPDGYTCAQLVTSIGAGDTGLTGGYCIKNGTNYDPNNACAQSCDPSSSKCPDPAGNQ
jgi:hypothetical protein